jgi:hypothetical protein
MAKRKHAAALFEVIKQGKPAGRTTAVPGALITPKWWFKRAGPRASAPASAGAATEAPAFPGSAAVPRGTTAAPEAQEAPAAAMRASGVDVSIDAERQRISLRMSYTSAAIACFALVVVLGLAFVIGRHMTRGPAPADGSTDIARLLSGPADRSVLDVPRTAANPVPSDSDSASTNTTPPTGNTSDAVAPQPPDAGPGSGVVVRGAERQIGLNYLIIQSYPPAEKKMADDALALLYSNGVGATIETGLVSDWYSVVGTDGFAHTDSSPEFRSYLAKIAQISRKASAGKQSFKAFDDPYPKKWDRPNR